MNLLQALIARLLYGVARDVAIDPASRTPLPPSWPHSVGLAILAPRPLLLHVPIRIALVSWSAAVMLVAIGAYLSAIASAVF